MENGFTTCLCGLTTIGVLLEPRNPDDKNLRKRDLFEGDESLGVEGLCNAGALEG